MAHGSISLIFKFYALCALPPFRKRGVGGILVMPKQIVPYHGDLKEKARELRKNMTESEQILWSRLRSRQILDVQFYRQKPIGPYITDFFAPKGNLVIEVDGSQHREALHSQKDKKRDAYLSRIGLCVLRFNSREVIKDTDSVVEQIYRVMKKRLPK